MIIRRNFIKIGLIGYGSIGERHYKNLKEYTSDIVVFSKRNDLKNIKSVSTWSDFLDQGPYESIFVTNETYKHVVTINKCIKLKPKAIFVEKPFSHNKDGLTEINKLIKKKKISFWIGYNFHFHKPFLHIKKLINKSVIGKVFYVRAFVGQDLREWRSRDYRMSFSSKHDQGGGPVLELVHDINYPSWILGEKFKLETAVVRKLSDLDVDTEDCTELVFISETGIMINVHQDCLRTPHKQYIEFAGEHGTIEWNSMNNMLSIITKDKVETEEIESERNDMFQLELKFFFESIEKNIFFTNIDEAIHDMNLISDIKKYGH